MTRIVIADDHAVVRSALRLLLDAEPGFTIVAEATTADDAQRRVQEHQPDILVLDLTMPGHTALDAIPLIRAESPRTQIVVLTMHTEPGFIDRALDAGALGYVLKEDAGSELIEAVRLAAAGEHYVSIAAAAAAANRRTTPQPGELSPREVEVIRLIGFGHTNPEIAEQLDISVRTVESHRVHIRRKLHVSSRRELVRYAIEHGLIDPPTTTTTPPPPE